ncbi:MAG: hypothetical protein WAN61_00340 [Minisyncoccia bacterium]
MNLMTITTKNPASQKYSVDIDLSALERIAGSLGLFQVGFIKDLDDSIREMKAGRLVKAKSLKDFR